MFVEQFPIEAEEKLRAEIRRIKNVELLQHASGWQENVGETVNSKVQLQNEKLLVKEIKYNALTCNMIRRALLKYQAECDYAQYEEELNDRGLTFHKDRL